MQVSFVDAAAARSGARAAALAVLLIILPPAIYYLLSLTVREPSVRPRFDNEAAAEERKDAAWGLAEVGLAGAILGAGLWTAHRNRAHMRLRLDEAGLHYRSMFREVRARWEEVIALEDVSVRGGGPVLRALRRAGAVPAPAAIRIRTRHGDILLPATMSAAAPPLPEVRPGPGGPVLVHADGRIESLGPRDGPLPRELLARMTARPDGS